jgi:lipopolysaccharide export system permease protein
MSILSRYLIRLHVVPFVFALGALTGLMLLNQIAKRFGDLAGKGLPWGVIIEVFALSVPFIVAMTLPMAVLVAVLYASTRLAADSEVTALRAGGISLWRILRPLLLAGGVLTLLAFAFSDHVLPRTNHRLRTL